MQTAHLSTDVDTEPARDHSGLATQIGQYEIIRLLGRGGMGEVHLARDLRLGRLVAVKLLATRDPDLEERFLTEARATARCHHENIVVIHEVGMHMGRPYMVLEYLEGQTLRQWLRDYTATAGPPARVPPARAVELMLPVVRALAYAHDQGIVHRDLKPENVMLTRIGGTKVLDFGLAKLVASRPDPGSADGAPGLVGDSSSRVGTLPYMSPEQVTLGPIDHRTDVWAAGIMLFELVAGARPLPEAAAPLIATVADDGTPMPSASEQLPEIGPLGQIIDRCLIKNRLHRTASARVLLAELEALLSGGGPRSQDGPPFAGLAAFQEADAGRFFGRDRDIERVVAELRSRPLVAVVGPSGAGKSSLVRAGVIPALKRSGEGWDAHIVRPGRQPLAALAVLARLDGTQDGSAGTAFGDGADRTLPHLRAEPGYLGARLRALATSKQRRIAVFVDQLEELYTLGVPSDERAAFLACLAAVADEPRSPLRVLVSMRSDFLDRLSEDRDLGAQIIRGLVLLPPMDRDGMRAALLQPVEASEHRFEPLALVDRIVDAVATTSGALPLLQFTATRLWDRRDRDRRILTEASYDEIGGVAGALATHADTVLAGMSAEQQALARDVLERLVTPERTRALVNVTELHALHRDPDLVDAVLEHLTMMRLVVVERGIAGADHTAELVHESLIDRWPTLVRWLEENHEDAAMRARLRDAARAWERSDHAAGLLWTGKAAHQADTWRRHYRGELTAAEQRYLSAVLAAAMRARRVRRRLLGGIVSATVLFAIAMAWLAWKQTKAGEKIAEEAMRVRDASRMAVMRGLSRDPTTQLALLREIEDLRAPPPWAVQEAQRLLHADIALVLLTSPEPPMWVSFTADGQRIVSASEDDAVRIWNADGRGEPRVVHSRRPRCTPVAHSPDGRRLAYVCAGDNTVQVWSTDERGEPMVLHGHTDSPQSAAFSPDGRRIVSGSRDRTVRVWDADGHGEPVVLHGHDDQVQSVAFSPDGRRIVSGSVDKTVRIWNADGRGEPVVLRGHDQVAFTVAFSVDGRHVVSASWDKTVRVWRTDGRGDPIVLRGHDDNVQSAVFSPDGRRIVSASWDKTVRVWSADGIGEPRVLRGHDDRVLSAAFSPDGRRIVSGSIDKTVRVWNVAGSNESPVLRRHDDMVVSAAFSPDGRRIVSATNDTKVRVSNADGTGEPVVLCCHDSGSVGSTAFSPDGLRIVSASTDKTVRVWNADGSGEPLVLRGHEAAVRSVAFSPDGRRIASASFDRTVRVWNADGSGEPLILRGHDDIVVSAAFSANGRRILSASFDKTVRVWNSDGSGEPLILRGHDGPVWSAAFSPDGQRVASASWDQTVRVWSADGRGEPLILRGHSGWVFWAEFSPDGHRIASASRDKTIRIWRADGTGDPVILTGHDLTVFQARFSPDGRRIVSASLDHTVRVWRDLAPVTLDDPRLWAATSYCMPIERRIDLLGTSQEQAQRDRLRCLERVERVRQQP